MKDDRTQINGDKSVAKKACIHIYRGVCVCLREREGGGMKVPIAPRSVYGEGLGAATL